MSCASCLHWKPLPQHSCGCVDDDNRPMFGDCRLDPPRIMETLLAGRLPHPEPRYDLAPETDIVNVVMEATRFPITARYDGCGKEEGQMPC